MTGNRRTRVQIKNVTLGNHDVEIKIPYPGYGIPNPGIGNPEKTDPEANSDCKSIIESGTKPKGRKILRHIICRT